MFYLIVFLSCNLNLWRLGVWIDVWAQVPSQILPSPRRIISLAIYTTALGLHLTYDLGSGRIWNPTSYLCCNCTQVSAVCPVSAMAHALQRIHAHDLLIVIIDSRVRIAVFKRLLPESSSLYSKIVISITVVFWVNCTVGISSPKGARCMSLSARIWRTDMDQKANWPCRKATYKKQCG
jgi:hypothetical protein